jgi:hypothetical protein
MRSTLPLFFVALAVSAPALAVESLPVPPFRSVELRGGGNVEVVPGPRERVTIVQGSSQFTHAYVDRSGKLIVETCNAECPHLYHMQLQIESPRVPDLAVSGGGAITVAPGFVPQPQLSGAINGGGKIDARAVEAADVSAAVNGGGDLLVHAASNLSGAVRGGGTVRYWGNPQVSSAIAGGGTIRRGY